MTTAQDTKEAILPDEIARRIVLPEGHADLASLYEAYKWMRDNMPVGKAVVEGYDPLWLVSKYADIQEVESLQPEVFSAGGGAQPGAHNPPILTNQAGDEFTKSMLGGSLRLMDALPFLDPPEHTTVKNIVFDYFKPARLKALEGAGAGTGQRVHRETEVALDRWQADRPRRRLGSGLSVARDHDLAGCAGIRRAPR